MEYISLYRRFRPKNFKEVIAQKDIIKVLENQIKTQNISHAYLFSGPRGTGKTSVAKIFAKAVNCSSNEKPCNNCSFCNDINCDKSLDFFEMDAASNNGVDNIRELNESVRFSPVKAKYKVIIIDEVHMLSKGAFNALLKTLEEPPHYIIFILATTEIEKIPATIVSRCQKFDFHSVANEDIVYNLKNICDKIGKKYDEKALYYIASVSSGGVRDSLSLLEQVVSYCDDKIDYDLTINILGLVEIQTLEKLLIAIIKSRNNENYGYVEIIDILNLLKQYGKEAKVILNEFLNFISDLIKIKIKKSYELDIYLLDLDMLNIYDLFLIQKIILQNSQILTLNDNSFSALELIFIECCYNNENLDKMEVFKLKEDINILTNKLNSLKEENQKILEIVKNNLTDSSLFSIEKIKNYIDELILNKVLELKNIDNNQLIHDTKNETNIIVENTILQENNNDLNVEENIKNLQNDSHEVKENLNYQLIEQGSYIENENFEEIDKIFDKDNQLENVYNTIANIEYQNLKEEKFQMQNELDNYSYKEESNIINLNEFEEENKILNRYFIDFKNMIEKSGALNKHTNMFVKYVNTVYYENEIIYFLSDNIFHFFESNIKYLKNKKSVLLEDVNKYFVNDSKFVKILDYVYGKFLKYKDFKFLIKEFFVYEKRINLTKNNESNFNSKIKENNNNLFDEYSKKTEYLDEILFENKKVGVQDDDKNNNNLQNNLIYEDKQMLPIQEKIIQESKNQVIDESISFENSLFETTFNLFTDDEMVVNEEYLQTFLFSDLDDDYIKNYKDNFNDFIFTDEEFENDIYKNINNFYIYNNLNENEFENSSKYLEEYEIEEKFEEKKINNVKKNNIVKSNILEKNNSNLNITEDFKPEINNLLIDNNLKNSDRYENLDNYLVLNVDSFNRFMNMDKTNLKKNSNFIQNTNKKRYTYKISIENNRIKNINDDLILENFKLNIEKEFNNLINANKI